MQVKYAEKAKDDCMMHLPYEWYALKIAIRELETNRWISVDKKLPKRNERTQNISKDVQVTVKDKFGVRIDMGYYNYKRKKWLDSEDEQITLYNAEICRKRG